MDNNISGKTGEDAVCDKLVTEGYRIIVRNFAVHNVGEIDVVAQKDNVVHVIEVKTRRASNIRNYGAPESYITQSKMHKIRKCTNYLIARYGLYDNDIVFDAGSVVIDRAGNVLSVDIFEI